jgi:hypothetical protein
VWARRIVYFLTVFASLFLAAMPLIEKWRPGRGPASLAEIVLPIVDLVGAFLPNFVKPWLDAFRNSPGRFLIGVVLVIVLMYAGGWIQGHIRDLMRRIWKRPQEPTAAPGGFVYKLRSAGPYRAFFYWLKHWALPTIFAAIILSFWRLSVLRWSIARCLRSSISRKRLHAEPVGGTGHSRRDREIRTRDVVRGDGASVERGKTYRVTFVVTEPQEDGYRPKEPNPKGQGYRNRSARIWRDKMRWTMAPGVPIRRLLASNWFEAVLRVGNRGFGEVVPSWERKDPPQCLCPAITSYTTTFKARKSGELFIYVNDSVLGWPGQFDVFYRTNNKGKADLTVELLNQ